MRSIGSSQCCVIFRNITPVSFLEKFDVSKAFEDFLGEVRHNAVVESVRAEESSKMTGESLQDACSPHPAKWELPTADSP